jgi:short-subunit dehydrogenase
METIAFLGCSRGLGKSVCLEMDKKIEAKNFLLFSRNEVHLYHLASQLRNPNKVITSDFSKRENLSSIIERLKEHQVSRVFYFAGGGPYGFFAKKQWKDHLWALQVSFLMPAQLLHQVLSDKDLNCVKQLIFIGSSVADENPDPMAASYSSAKHGLKGLVESIQSEGCDKDLRLFRPGYMNTDLLPINATPRQSGADLQEPDIVAEKFVEWALNPNAIKVIQS